MKAYKCNTRETRQPNLALQRLQLHKQVSIVQFFIIFLPLFLFHIAYIKISFIFRCASISQTSIVSLTLSLIILGLQRSVDLIIDINTGLHQLSNANNYQMPIMLNVNNVKCQHCQMSTLSNVNNVKCQQCQMSMSKCKLYEDLSRSVNRVKYRI